MKRGQIILLVIFLVVSGLIYVALKMNQKSFSKEKKEEQQTIFVPIRKVKNEVRSVEITSYGQISPNVELIVSMEIQGKLMQGDRHLKPGMTFRKGELLYQVDIDEAFYTLSARKTNLSNLIVSAMPEIELDFPSETNKWQQYIKELNPDKRMPSLPELKSSKEKMFLTSRGILAEYYNIRSLESRMDKYYFIAPFNGTVVETYLEPGSIVNPGSQIAKIAKSGDFEVKVPIELSDLDLYQARSSVEFTNAKGDVIGTGKLLRISDVINQQTQSADAYYSISPVKGQKIYHGLFVNASINIKEEKVTMALPRNALSDNKAYILNGRMVEPKNIIIVGSKPDTVFVTGLKDNEKVLLERMETIDKNINYEGIIR